MFTRARKLREIRPRWFIATSIALTAAAAVGALAAGFETSLVIQSAVALLALFAVAAWIHRRPFRLRDDRDFIAFKREFREFKREIAKKLDKNQVSHYSRKHQINDLKRSIEAIGAQSGDAAPVETGSASTLDAELLRTILAEDREAGREALDRLTVRLAALEQAVAEYRISLHADRIRQNIGEPLLDLGEEIALVQGSPLFDRDYYLSQAGEVNRDPVEHYILVGSDLGYDPHPLFDSRFYRRNNPQATVRHRSCLAHFLDASTVESGDPCLMFDTAWYNRQIDDDLTPAQAVLDYLEKGDLEDRDPSPLFDTAWYRTHFGNIIPGGTSMLAHYLTEGRKHGWSPNAAFDREALSKALEVPPEADLTATVAMEIRELAGSAPERPQHPTTDYWKWHNLATGAHREDDTFAFYRILGNDLPPRHQSGQTYTNLKFILEHEPVHTDCRKIWILNRIIDAEEKSKIIDLLDRHGAEYIDIPVDWDEYREIGWNFRGLLGTYPSYGADFDKHYQQNAGHRYREHIYHNKNLYLINNNGARNTALQHGRGIAKWVLPWDGNCFITEKAWAELRHFVATNSHLRYVLVPMARLAESNEVLLDPDFSVKAKDEPQLVFRADTEIEFNPDYRYGHRPKVELFRRLQIPGNWDRWPTYSWDPEITVETGETNAWGKASWVARLYSGSPALESAEATGLRGQSRSAGIRLLIDERDVDLVKESFDPSRLFSLDDEALDTQVESHRTTGTGLVGGVVDQLVASAREHLRNSVYSPRDKTTVAPSKDPGDYWNPAPYWWPNVDSPDGLPYVRRDGHRVPGTILGAPGSEKYDRTNLQRMIDETFTNALAYRFSGEDAFAEKAAAQVRAWFVDPERRMNPHLRYAQVRLGHNHDVGSGRGILETKDFYYLLDAVRIIERDGFLTSSDSEELRSWFHQFREWLTDSPQGRSECGAGNNHGTWFDVQAAAIDSFIDNPAGLQETFRRVFERVGHQFSPEDGSQPEELARTLTQHYCAYNLSGWLVLNDQATRIGASLRDFSFPDGAGLSDAVSWIGLHGGRPWAFEQIDPFDEDRFQAIGLWADGAGLVSRPWDWLRPLQTVKPVFSVHDGIRPYWMVGNPSLRHVGER